MQKINSRLNWTAEEEEYLKTLREIQGYTSWTSISNALNQAFQGKNRSGKQCRERYMNYVRFNDCDYHFTKWTPTQDEVLFKNFLIHGRKWVQICKEMQGKSQNCLKNRFYGAMRKIARRIAKSHKELKIKVKKNLKQEIFIKILEAADDCIVSTLREDGNDLLIELKHNLIKLAIAPDQSLSHENVMDIVNRIHMMNTLLKSSQCQKRAQMEQKNKTEPSCQLKLTQKQTNSIIDDQEIKISILAIDEPLSHINIEKHSQQAAQALKKQEQTYLLDLGFGLDNVNGSMSYDLEKEASKILDLQFIETIPQIF